MFIKTSRQPAKLSVSRWNKNVIQSSQLANQPNPHVGTCIQLNLHLEQRREAKPSVHQFLSEAGTLYKPTKQVIYQIYVSVCESNEIYVYVFGRN